MKRKKAKEKLMDYLISGGEEHISTETVNGAEITYIVRKFGSGYCVIQVQGSDLVEAGDITDLHFFTVEEGEYLITRRSDDRTVFCVAMTVILLIFMIIITALLKH